MPQCQFDYSGKTVFVAGGTSGINLGIAHGFAKVGANLAVLSRSQEKVDAAVADLKQYGGEVLGYSADVRDYAQVESAFAQASELLGPIDVLISGAAGNFPAAAAEMSANAFKTVIDIDLLGTFNVLRSAYGYLRKPGACVINISAPQSFVTMEMQSHVCAAKAGVDMLTRTTAMEWGPEGVRVNSLLPGPIEGTEGMRRLAPTPEMTQACKDSVPLKRYGTLDDVANVALMLASDQAAYISGVVLPVDGGWALSGAGAMGRELAAMARTLAKK